MNRTLARLLTLIYPSRWRARYGVEFQALLESSEGGMRVISNTFWLATREHFLPTQGGNMKTSDRSFGSILRLPSAFLPLAMSFTALAMVLATVATSGVQHGGDEGAVAHLWQLLMAGQVPIVAFFGIKWMRLAPLKTISVLGLQAAAVLASCAPVFFLNL